MKNNQKCSTKKISKLLVFVFLNCIIFSLFVLGQTTYADIPSSGYATATITNPSSDVTDFSLLIDLSRMPANWWSAVNTSDGTKGRVAKNDGTELATDWINFDNAGHTGWLRVLWSGTLASSGSQVLKIYPPISTNSSYGASDTYGSNSAYASHWVAYYTLDEAVNNNAGGYIDRTVNTRNATGVSMGLPVVTGKVGNAADFDGIADHIKYDNLTQDFTQGTILTWATNGASGLRSYAEISPNMTSNRILLFSNGTTLVGYIGTHTVASKASAISAGVLKHIAFSWDTTPDTYELYIGGTAQSAGLSVAESLTTVSRRLAISIGQDETNYPLAGYQDDVQIHSTALSAPWIAEEYAQTNSNATFWGTWTWSAGVVGNPSAPTLVSPANDSFTADNTPTLSAQYIDDDSVGTTNYRIASTTANDCLSGVNLITSGTSAITATNNEATVFTPSSSIGSDATYYWCAQNVNGLNASDWTTLGSLTLDKTNPSIPGTPTATSNTADNTPTWTWTVSTDNGSGLHLTTPYTVEWSQDINFVSGVFTSTSGTNSFTHTDSLANGTWYFRVSAKDAVNNESTFSANGSILIDANASTLLVTYVSTDANGVKSYNMSSDRNGNGTHTLRVLEPDNPVAGVAHSFLYVLTAEAELNATTGDGLETLRALGAQNQYNVTIISPSFKIQPWYADHDTNPDYRYESFMALELQPWVKYNFATSGNEQHWLLGFSKSGFGPMSLILEHPDIFTLGAFWDFPANMSDYTSYGANANYGTQANFDSNYRLTSTFLENHKTLFLNDNRIWINGYGLFRTDVQNFDTLLTTKGILHTTAPEVSRAHNWTSGWVPSALAGLYANSTIVSTEITTTDSGIDTSWHNANVTVTLTCNDSSGSGCAHTYYTTDGTSPDTSSSQGTSVVVSANGSHTIKYFSINNIGQQEAIKTAANIAKIDKQNPTISAGDDQNKGVAFTQVATASDSGSDINVSTYQWAKVSGPGLITFGSDTALSTTISADTNGTYVISFTASDNAGNSSTDNFTLVWNVTTSGGGGCYNCYVNPSVPSSGFKMSINGGVSTTSNRNVFLGFNAGTDIKKLAISMTDDFTDASQENYVASKQWDLCSKLGGAVKNPTCPDGKYTVYARFYTAWGRTSDSAVASSTITLQSGIVAENLQQYANLPFTNPFTKYLQYRQTNADIKRLQIFLNADPDTKIADFGAGSPGKETNYFGLLTYKAVIRFQEKYARDILVPWGFKKGTGYVGKTTLAKINELMKSK